MAWLWEDIANLASGFYDLFAAAIMALLYPLVVGISVMQNIWTVFYVTFAAFYNAMLLIPNTFIDLINVFFVGVMPTAIIGLMGANLFIVLGLRLYSFIKDVSIFGWKI